MGSMTSSANMRSFAAAVSMAILISVMLPAPAAQAWSNGACTTSNGVTVVVDFAGLGGGTTVRCAPGNQSSGISALRNAGFNVGFVQENSSQGLFICRIDNKPSPSEESCADTPPASASWSYWNASRGGSWLYSNAGAGNRKPPAGSVEGWRFINGRPVAPSVAVPAALATAKPSSSSSSSSSSHGPIEESQNKETSKVPSTSGSSSSGNSGSSSASHSASASSSTSPSSSASNSAADAQSPSASKSQGGVQAAGPVDGLGQREPSSPVGTLVTLAALVLLGVLAGVAWSRRSRDA